MSGKRKNKSVQARIAVVTGSRAEWSLLEPLVEQLDKEFELKIIVTGSHLSPRFTQTCGKWIEYDFYPVEILLDADTLTGTCTSIGLGLIKIAEILDKLNPDCVLLLGDRFEILSAALSAYNLGIPIAHIHGGDVTTGSLDDGYRDCISRLSNYHFVATQYAFDRLQGKTSYINIYHVGSLGCVFPNLDNINMPCDYLVVYHPGNEKELSNIIGITEHLPNVVYIGSNADAGGRSINYILESVRENGQDVYGNLSRELYLKLLSNAKCIIGNSSSGIIEAPSLGTPTVNIGSRQQGRIKAASVIDCEGTVDSIKLAITEAKKVKFPVDNPYYKPNTVESIVNILKEQL